MNGSPCPYDPYLDGKKTRNGRRAGGREGQTWNRTPSAALSDLRVYPLARLDEERPRHDPLAPRIPLKQRHSYFITPARGFSVPMTKVPRFFRGRLRTKNRSRGGRSRPLGPRNRRRPDHPLCCVSIPCWRSRTTAGVNQIGARANMVPKNCRRSQLLDALPIDCNGRRAWIQPPKVCGPRFMSPVL